MSVNSARLFATETPSRPRGSCASVRFQDLSALFATIEALTMRGDMQQELTNFFVDVMRRKPRELLPTVYLTCNRVAPQFVNLELGVGHSILQKSIAQSFGCDLSEIEHRFKAVGDLGIVAEEFHGALEKTVVDSMSVKDVHSAFLELSTFRGAKSQEKKINAICHLFEQCSTKEESKYLVWSLQKKMRLGFADQTVLLCLAHAAVCVEAGVDFEDVCSETMSHAVVVVKQAYAKVPSFDILIPSLINGGIEEVQRTCMARPGVPIQPMLSRPARSVRDALDIMFGIDGKAANESVDANEPVTFACELKYDGERGQVHVLEDGSVEVFSRNMESSTGRFPDIATLMTHLRPEVVDSCILDCEIVAYDRDTGEILSFQALSKRGRKRVDEDALKVQVLLLVFDLLFLNGVSTLGLPYPKRQRLLREHFQDVPGRLKVVDSHVVSTEEEVEAHLERSIRDRCEGLMIKSVATNSTYDPSRRTSKWLKLKHDYLDGFGDSLDLVPIGAWMGQGKRSEFYGTYLCACFNPQTRSYETVCKLGTGLSDAQLKDFHEAFHAGGHILRDKPDNFSVVAGTNMSLPDVWIAPNTVWEVKGSNLSLSPVHSAGKDSFKDLNLNEKVYEGIALRFPRLIRVRTDKNVECASTSIDIANILSRQQVSPDS